MFFFPKNFPILFWTMSKKSFAFCRISFGGVVKTAFHVSREIFWQDYFFLNHFKEIFVGKNLYFFYPSRILSGKLLANCQQFFSWVAKTAFYVFMRPLWRKLVFYKVFRYLFIDSGHWAKHFWTSVKKFSEGLSKLLSSCP